MADQYRIVETQLPLVGGLGGHNLLAILDPSGNVVRELNGIATNPQGEELPIGFIPFYHKLTARESIGEHYYGNAQPQTQTTLFTGEIQDVMGRWNAALEAATSINSKNFYHAYPVYSTDPNG